MSNNLNTHNAAGRLARLVVAVVIFFVALLFVPIFTSPIYRMVGFTDIGTQATLDFVIVCGIVLFFAIYPFYFDMKHRLNSNKDQNDSPDQ